jgi:hypothetical protein
VLHVSGNVPELHIHVPHSSHVLPERMFVLPDRRVCVSIAGI